MGLNFLTTKEVAVALHVSEATIRRWIKAKIIPVIHVTKRKLLFDPDKVAAAVKRRVAS